MTNKIIKFSDFLNEENEIKKPNLKVKIKITAEVEDWIEYGPNITLEDVKNGFPDIYFAPKSKPGIYPEKTDFGSDKYEITILESNQDQIKAHDFNL